LLEAARKSEAAGEPAQANRTLSEVKVRRTGDTAVLIAILTRKQGDAPAISNRRTLTWVRQDGRWRLMHDQSSLVGAAGESEYWSEYFRGDNQNFNRKPNSLLVATVAGLRPGKALDVGMGEGRNAIHLAKQGWDVTGIDRAEGALAVTRQKAIEQGVKITPILQSADEFDWGQDRWDLVALLYVPAVRGNVAKIRESLKPGGLVVIEAFLVPPASPTRGVEYKPEELRKMFSDGFEILRYEEAEGIADYGQKKEQLVRLVGRKSETQASAQCQASGPAPAATSDSIIKPRRSRRGR